MIHIHHADETRIKRLFQRHAPGAGAVAKRPQKVFVRAKSQRPHTATVTISTHDEVETVTAAIGEGHVHAGSIVLESHDGRLVADRALSLHGIGQDVLEIAAHQGQKPSLGSLCQHAVVIGEKLSSAPVEMVRKAERHGLRPERFHQPQLLRDLPAIDMQADGIAAGAATGSPFHHNRLYATL